jgi:hypothetical protein
MFPVEPIIKTFKPLRGLRKLSFGVYLLVLNFLNGSKKLTFTIFPVENY